MSTPSTPPARADTFAATIAAAAAEASLHVDGDTRARLVAYAETLATHNARANLVGTTEPDRLARELLVDALRLLPLLAQADALAPRRLVDVGAGAGLPSIPLLCALPGWSGVAAEPRERRRTFLAIARRAAGLGDRLRIVDARVDLDANPLGSDFDLAVSRAVFPPLTWVAVAPQLVAPGGLVAVYAADDDAPEAPWRTAALEELARSTYTVGDRDRVVVLLRRRAG